MITVVEGISAAGKTTWCRAHAAAHLVPETFPEERRSWPETGSEVARAWTDWNAHRWTQALEMEQRTGHAVCDTDPLKLHYLWGLCRIGEMPWPQWDLQLAETRAAIAEHRLGLADLYLIKTITPEAARTQRDGDIRRTRDRFELHLRLMEPLTEWYVAMEGALAGRVRWTLPPDMPDNTAPNPARYDLAAFDGLIAALPRSR
ncbi:hypothetical protein [Pontivivens ytuae]|uniref:Thymidylate kinase n=1 Tax=Pontivivens ytuae TaxID=2789856 RepID=A0A7S9LP04_9RHOB|nr:hypothetical protein [Pontivivens ytuae]QPH52512.1 hypothetical protein I0K15_11815 [Pontivivens ytuae]